MIVINSVFPVFALILLGSVLKARGFVESSFLRSADRLTYFILFPALLFWKIAGGSGGDLPKGLCMAAITALAVVYLLSTLYIVLMKVPAFAAGSFSQGCYRFNTYMGMAIIMSALGEEGIRTFGVLIGLTIPTINVLAVATLIWFSGRKQAPAERIRLTVKALLSNPLVIACACGILYARIAPPLPLAVDNTLRLLAMPALPLALLSIGGSLTFAGFRQHLRLSLVTAGFKLVVFPAAGLLCLKLFSVTGLHFRVGMIFFTLPTSTAIYVLSSQLNSDTDLALSAIVLSTLLSAFTLSAALLI